MVLYQYLTIKQIGGDVMKKIEREIFLTPEYKEDEKGEIWMNMVESDIYCKVKKSDLDALEAKLEEATNLIKAVIKWNADYPSSRIYSHSQIVGIADEMDVIFEQCKSVMTSWEEIKAWKG